jgi:tRNA pseudouridine55 synthase
MPYDFVKGEILLIDKPVGWTSFDVVNKIRYAVRDQLGRNAEGKAPKIKVGHAGTLDPLASGLLIVCTGKATKGIDALMAGDKEYTGTITFGASTPSYDRETEPDHVFDMEGLSEDKIKEVLPAFTGNIEQLPPMFSAIKQDGQKLYELARKGKTVALNPRNIRIDVFELLNFRLPEVDFRIRCSKGTYIRSIAHDLGKALHNGAHLSSLRRTMIGPYHVKDAFEVQKFVEMLRS